MKKAILLILTVLIFIATPFITSFILGQAGSEDLVTINDAGKTVRMQKNDFLLSAVLSVAEEDFSDETLKALATVFSTLLSYGGVEADSERGVLLIDTESVDAEFRERVKAAIEAAGNNIILYEGQPIYSVFHKSSGGKTLDSESVFEQSYPYLVSVESDEVRGEQVFTAEELSEKIGISSSFSVTLLNDDGSVGIVMAGNKTFTGREFREKLGIMSPVFSLLEKEGNLYVSYKGEGHGVGLSIMGAESLAQEGKTAEEILSFYYKNTEIAKLMQ